MIEPGSTTVASQTNDSLQNPLAGAEPHEASVDPPGQRRQDWIANLVERYESPLLAYACRLLAGDRNGAEDMVQETFLRLCREPREKIEPRIPAWLFAVCRSRIIDAARQRREVCLADDTSPPVDPQPTIADTIAKKEDAADLALRMERLSPRQQEVLRLRIQADLSYREIAEITGMTVSNVGFHLHAAVAALRQVCRGDGR